MRSGAPSLGLEHRPRPLDDCVQIGWSLAIVADERLQNFTFSGRADECLRLKWNVIAEASPRPIRRTIPGPQSTRPDVLGRRRRTATEARGAACLGLRAVEEAVEHPLVVERVARREEVTGGRDDLSGG